MTHIAVVGSWHLAFVTAAGLAELGHHVTLFSGSKQRLDIHEPDLDALIEEMRARGRLNFHTYVGACNAFPDNIDVLWLCVDTPLHDDDSPNVEPLIMTLDNYKARLVVISSQVPVGFCQAMEKKLGKPVAYVPENLRLGSAVEIFRNPDRLVIGATLETTRNEVASFFKNTPVKPMLCDLPTAEMVKHGTNAFFATSISLANELARVGEMYGADTQFVAQAMKADSRIGTKAYVRPGLGFAGGTLPRDLWALQGSPFSATRNLPLIKATLQVNADVLECIAQTTVSLLPPVPRTACLLGYTYKAETDALRSSPTKILAQRLREIGRGSGEDVNVLGYDPRMTLESGLEIIGPGHRGSWSACEGRPGVDVFVCVTPLREFKAIDWSKCVGATVYDLCDGIDREAVFAAGLSYKAIWQPIETSKCRCGAVVGKTPHSPLWHTNNS